MKRSPHAREEFFKKIAWNLWFYTRISLTNKIKLLNLSSVLLNLSCLSVLLANTGFSFGKNSVNGNFDYLENTFPPISCIAHDYPAREGLFYFMIICMYVLQLHDRSLPVTHNLAVFGGCGLVLSIITGLLGINVDGIPGAESTPYAFALFAGLLFFLGAVLIAVALIYLGLKKPIREEDFEARKLELEHLVKMFQYEAETHAQVHNPVSRHNLPPTAGKSSPTTLTTLLSPNVPTQII